MAALESGSWRRGSVLILVVVLLAVLFVIGMGFLAMSRIDSATTAASQRAVSEDLEVDSVIQRITAVLASDLWGGDSCLLGSAADPTSDQIPDEPWDYPYTNPANFGIADDAWLADVLPENPRYDFYDDIESVSWRHVSNISGLADFGRGVSDTSPSYSELDVDTDKDGAKDAYWLLSPSGRFRYAVRIIDLCGMVNLNVSSESRYNQMGDTTAQVDAYHVNSLASNDTVFESDCNLIRTDYRFGRGGHPDASQTGGSLNSALSKAYDLAFHIDDPFIRRYVQQNFTAPQVQPQLFRTYDTLGILAYGAKGGPVMPRMARSWPSVFDPVTHYKIPDILQQTNGSTAMPPDWSVRPYYTTESWTRNLRSRIYPANLPAFPNRPDLTAASWAQLLDEFDPSGLGRVYVNYNWTTEAEKDRFSRALVAAIVLAGTDLTQRQIEQLVVNLIDWRDADQEISVAGAGGANQVDTVWNTAGIYGNEPQVFITEVAARIYPNDASSGQPSPDNLFAVELFNPYGTEIPLAGWRIDCGTAQATLPGGLSPLGPGQRLVVRSASHDGTVADTSSGDYPWPPMPVPSSGPIPTVPADSVCTVSALNFFPNGSAATIKLKRPASGGTFVAVDEASAARVAGATTAAGWLTAPAAGNSARDFFASRPDERWMQSREAWRSGQDLGSMGGKTIVKFEQCTWGRPNKDYWVYARLSSTSDPYEWRWATDMDWSKVVGWPNSYSALDSWISGAWAAFAGGLAAPIPIAASAQDHGFDTLGQLHLLLTVGPSTNTSVVNQISAATTSAAVSALYLDFSNATRGDYRILENLDRFDRRYNGTDDNGDRTADSVAELRLPGLININTACPHVLSHMNYYMYPAESWHYIANSDPQKYKTPDSRFNFGLPIYNYRNDPAHLGFRHGVGELMLVDGLANTQDVLNRLAFAYTTNSNNVSHLCSARNRRAELDWYEPPSYSSSMPLHPQVSPNDTSEKHFIFDRISDVATTRSDCFLAYIVIQPIRVRTSGSYWVDGDLQFKGGMTRMVVIFDRSRCNRPPGSADYSPPRVIARSTAIY